VVCERSGRLRRRERPPLHLFLEIIEQKRGKVSPPSSVIEQRTKKGVSTFLLEIIEQGTGRLFAFFHHREDVLQVPSRGLEDVLPRIPSQPVCF